MPFKSRKQQDFLRINEPEIYNRWMRLYGPYEADSESWQGISLAGKVDEISEMLDTRKKKAEGDPTWMRDPEQKRKVSLRQQKKDGVPRVCEVCEEAYTSLYYYNEDGETFVVCRPCVQRSEKEWGEMFGIKPDWTRERGGRTRTAIMEADESKWIVSSDDIQVGDKVRSYDFCFGGKTLQLDSYVEGYVLQIAPVEWCSPNCNHYHIRTTARLMGGKVQEDYEDYYFPVADANQTVVRRLRSMNAETFEAENVFIFSDDYINYGKGKMYEEDENEVRKMFLETVKKRYPHISDDKITISLEMFDSGKWRGEAFIDAPIGSRLDAENWGGDPDGQLAQALAKARAKSKEPRRPLKITKLPHRDQKTLKDFEADNEEVAFQMTRKDIALVSFGAILGVISGVVGEVLAEFWLDRYRRDPELVVSEEKENA